MCDTQEASRRAEAAEAPPPRPRPASRPASMPPRPRPASSAAAIRDLEARQEASRTFSTLGRPAAATMTAALDRRTGLPSGNLKATQSTNRRAIQAGELQSEHGGRLHVCSKGSNHSRMIKKNRPAPLTSDNLDAKENVRLFLFSSGNRLRQARRFLPLQIPQVSLSLCIKRTFPGSRNPAREHRLTVGPGLSTTGNSYHSLFLLHASLSD